MIFELNFFFTSLHSVIEKEKPIKIQYFFLLEIFHSKSDPLNQPFKLPLFSYDFFMSITILKGGIINSQDKLKSNKDICSAIFLTNQYDVF